MHQLRDKASLDEKTVQKVAKGSIKRRRPVSKGKRPIETKKTTVDPFLMAYLRQKNIRLSEVEVLSPTEVIVR